MAQELDNESCDAPNLGEILTRVSKMQGMILKNYLVEEKIAVLRQSLIDLAAEQSRITATIAMKESQLDALVDEAQEVKCELGHVEDRD